MATIRTLKPNVSRSQAVEQFTGGALGFAREFVSGPLRSVADFYIPFLVFDVCITNRGEQQKQIWGIDAVNGSLDPYHFGQVPGTEDSLTRESASIAVLDAVRRQPEWARVRRLLEDWLTAGTCLDAPAALPANS